MENKDEVSKEYVERMDELVRKWNHHYQKRRELFWIGN